MVTADGIAEGVPSIVSDALDWCPEYWKAYSDDVPDMARVGRQLLYDPLAAYDGLISLDTHNAGAFEAWCNWLGINKEFPYRAVVNQRHLKR
jgi:hypothetical protein